MTANMGLASPARSEEALRHQWIAASSGAGRLGPGVRDARHPGDDFHGWLELVAQELGIGPVRDSQPDIYGFELLVDEEPHASTGLRRSKRREERIDRL